MTTLSHTARGSVVVTWAEFLGTYSDGTTTGLDGDSASGCTATDNDETEYCGAYDYIDVGSTSGNIVVRVRIKKQAQQAYMPCVSIRVIDIPTSLYYTYNINPQTGATGQSRGSPHVAADDVDCITDWNTDWWEFYLQVPTDGSAAEITVHLYPAYGTTTTSRASSTTGTSEFDGLEVFWGATTTIAEVKAISSSWESVPPLYSGAIDQTTGPFLHYKLITTVAPAQNTLTVTIDDSQDGANKALIENIGLSLVREGPDAPDTFTHEILV